MSYIYAILILLGAAFFVLSIMSVISMIVLGRKYFQRIKAMWDFKVDKVFSISVGTWGFGIISYYFVSINDDVNVYLFSSSSSTGGLFSDSYFHIEHFTKINDNWKSERYIVSYSPCFITTLLKFKVKNQFKKNMKYDVPTGTGKEMSIYINNIVLQSSRDKKIEKLLNGRVL